MPNRFERPTRWAAGGSYPFGSIDKRSLYSVIEGADKHRLNLADEWIPAITGEGKEAALLGIDVGFLLSLTQRLVYDVLNAVIEFGYSLIRVDHYISASPCAEIRLSLE
jgi:DNA-binding GntR family transcriptional regulator